MSEVSRSKEDKLVRKRKSSSERELSGTDVESTGGRSANTSPTLRSRNMKQFEHRNLVEKEKEDIHSVQEQQTLSGDVERARQRVLEKLKDIRRRAVASRDEHRRQLLVIERQVSASTAALLRAKTMREAKKKLPEFEQMQKTETNLFHCRNFQVSSKQFPVSFSSAPALPASYIYGQSDPPQTLAYEENVLKLARGIVKKNTDLAMLRLPKQPEPPRAKVLWDYLLDEVVWLAIDFREERKHKIFLAKKVADECMFRSLNSLCNEEERRARANTVASLVAKYWIQLRNLYLSGSKDMEKSVTDVEEQQLEKKLEMLDDMKSDARCLNEENVGLGGVEDVCEMTEAHTLLSDSVVPTEEQRDEEMSALFDSVNSMSSSVDPAEYLTSAEHNATSEGEATDEIMNSDKTVEKMSYDALSGGDVAEKNSCVDFGFFKKSLESFLDKLGFMSGNEIPSNLVERVSNFNGSLKEFQLQTVQWLASCYKRKWNALLADDGNCGKTISVIAFLKWLADQTTNMDPCLVICPISELEHFEKECRRWLPESQILTIDNMSEGFLNGGDPHLSRSERLVICLCSYDHLKKVASSLNRRKWHCLVLKDEHSLRNLEKETLKELENLETRFRTVLTDNYEECSFRDLWGYLQLLMPKVLPPELRNVDTSFIEGLSSKYLRPMKNKLEKVIKPRTLRRKKEVLQPFFPKKTEQVLACSLSRRQRKIYDEFISSNKLLSNLDLYPCDNLPTMLQTLTRLCNHAELVEPTVSSSPVFLPCIQFRVPKETTEIYDMQKFSYESNFFLIRKSLSLLHFELYSFGNKERNFEDSQTSGSNFLSGEEEWQDAFRFLVNYNSSFQDSASSERKILCESTSCLNILERSAEHLVEPLIGNSSICSSLVLSRIFGLTSRNPLNTFSFCSDLLAVSEMQIVCRPFSMLDFRIRKALAETPVMNHPHKRHRDDLNLLGITSLQSTFEPEGFSSYWLSYDLETNSGKLTCLRVLLESLKKQNRRCIVVVDNMEVLDILEYFMRVNKFAYFRLDSTLPLQRRYIVAMNFCQNLELLCCIMNVDAFVSSLKFPGVDTLVYFEHRLDSKDAQVDQTICNLSQDRPVHIYHMVSTGTIEEKLLSKRSEIMKCSLSISQRETNEERRRIVSELLSGNENIESGSTGNSSSRGPAKSSSFVVSSSSVEELSLELYFNSLVDNETKEKKQIDSLFSVCEMDPILDNTEISLENTESFSGLQSYCFHILDRIRSEAYAPMKLAKFKSYTETSRQGMTDPFAENLLQRELFYTRMMDEDSLSSYSRAVDNSNSDLKIYLPLHDGGKEEMTMSTVVDKTAAVGIESAEDAAFFPYAYSRLSRTSDATRLQKAKLQEEKILEQNGQNSSVSKGTDSWEGNCRTGTMSPLTNKQLQSHERKNRTGRRSFLDGSEENFLQWTADEDRELIRAVKSCYQNFMIIKYWLRWTTFSLCRLKRPRTENECKVRFESFSDSSEGATLDATDKSSIETHLLKKHLSVLLSTFQEKYKQGSGNVTSNDQGYTQMESHPSYGKLAKSVLGESTTVMPDAISFPKAINEEWKPGYKTTDHRAQQPFIRRTPLFSRVGFQSSGSALSTQGTLRHFRQRPQRSEIHGRNLRGPSNSMGTWPYEQSSQLLNAKSLARTRTSTAMTSSNFSMRPTILTKLMRKQSQQSRNWSTDTKLSFESGTNYQNDGNLATSKHSQGVGRLSVRGDAPSAASSLSRFKRQADDELQTSTNTLKRSRKSLRLDETG